MKVIGYIRVSTEEQAVHGQSLDAQRAKLEAYAGLYELELVEIIVEGRPWKHTSAQGILARAA